MELSTARMGKQRPDRGPFLRTIAVVGLLLLIVLGYWIYLQIPNNEKVEPFAGKQNPITYKGDLLPDQALMVKNQELFLSLTFIKQQIDPNIYWDKQSKSVIITTTDKVLRFPEGKVQAFVNGTPFEIEVPVENIGQEEYVPVKPLANIYPFHIESHPDTGIYTLQKSGDVQRYVLTASSNQKAQAYYVRTDATIKAPYVAAVGEGTKMLVWGTKGNWDLVELDNGIVGYMDQKNLKDTTEKKTVEIKTEEPKPVALQLPYGKVNLTWEQVAPKTQDWAKIPSMPGTNVVSPTWFELHTTDGDILSRASLPYVEGAHQRGYQVWALFSNGFNPDFTHGALSTYDNRKKMIAQLLEYAAMYHLDGINLDFENVYGQDKDNLVEFVRELTPYLHEKKLIVSMDVSVKSSSERWSQFYDRKRLGEVVDYMMLMAYDEYGVGSKQSGSVASLPWVEAGIKSLLEEVPPSKLLLGVPFYTRLWKEEKDAGGHLKVTSKALSMPAQDRWIKEKNVVPVWDEKSGQPYVEYVDSTDQATYKMWLEDQDTMKERAQLAMKYGLAGIASWRRGFEDPATWTTIQEIDRKK